jgi:hypothetical protein
MNRRLKYSLSKANIAVALGGVDFSFNEDRAKRHSPCWCPYFYLITSSEAKKTLSTSLKRFFKKGHAVWRPVWISAFENDGSRRSYALKMDFVRRIGYHVIKLINGKVRKLRRSRKDKLRSAERLELFIHLNQIGFAERMTFFHGKPVVKSHKVKIEKC